MILLDRKKVFEMSGNLTKFPLLLYDIYILLDIWLYVYMKRNCSISSFILVLYLCEVFYNTIIELFNKIWKVISI